MRVLVIRLTALGDVVLVEPVVRALRATFGGVTVELVTEARYAPLMERAAGFDRVVAWDRRGEDAGLRGIRQVQARLHPEGYDAVVDLQAKLRTRMLASRVAAKARITLKKRSFGRGLLAALGHDPPIADRHAVDLYFGALSPLGVAPEALGPEPGPKLLVHAAEARRAQGSLRIGLGPGATHATKRWPAERFAALADRISVRHPDSELVLVGGPEERGTFETIRGSATRARFATIDTTTLDVGALACEIAALDLYAGVDSGPAHIAAACGVPVVAIFGPTSPVRWGPRGPEHRLATLALDCAPCSNTGGARCPLPGAPHTCLADLSVDHVLEQILAVLAGPTRMPNAG